jgi:hypothetical protein
VRVKQDLFSTRQREFVSQIGPENLVPYLVARDWKLSYQASEQSPFDVYSKAQGLENLEILVPCPGASFSEAMNRKLEAIRTLSLSQNDDVPTILSGLMRIRAKSREIINLTGRGRETRAALLVVLAVGACRTAFPQAFPGLEVWSHLASMLGLSVTFVIGLLMAIVSRTPAEKRRLRFRNERRFQKVIREHSIALTSALVLVLVCGLLPDDPGVFESTLCGLCAGLSLWVALAVRRSQLLLK